MGFKNPLKVLMLESKPLGLDSPKLKLWKECECLDERAAPGASLGLTIDNQTVKSLTLTLGAQADYTMS
ncbi:MAG: hypothetical protein B6247_19855 [Candidatus Parabeggiatoa sp. nov. 2]|nr:MAG: hypothetical protein B6247_19855 [Beggiatoa sp. 4572_84]